MPTAADAGTKICRRCGFTHDDGNYDGCPRWPLEDGVTVGVIGVHVEDAGAVKATDADGKATFGWVQIGALSVHVYAAADADAVAAAFTELAGILRGKAIPGRMGTGQVNNDDTESLAFADESGNVTDPAHDEASGYCTSLPEHAIGEMGCRA